MKSNTIQRLLVVAAITLACVYLIYPTMRYFSIVGNPEGYTEEELTELRLKSVPLGLDLQGGVDVLLAVDTEKTQASKVNDIAETIRRKFSGEVPTIDGSVQPTSGSKTISVTVNRDDQVRAADAALIELAEFGEFNYTAGSLKANTPLELAVNEQSMTQNLEKTIDSSIRVIRNRVDGLGVTQPVVVKQGRDRIRVQIPGEKDPERAISNMIRPAKLEFRGVHTATQAVPHPDGGVAYNENSEEFIDVTTGEPLEGKRIPPGYEAMRMKRGTTEPGAEDEYSYILVNKRVEMTGAGLKDASVFISQDPLTGSEVQVSVEFNREGAARFSEISERYMSKPLAIILDGIVYSAPSIRSRIENQCSITGGFTTQEAQDLSLVLKAGALPAELITLDTRAVEATLGADSISQSVQALLIGSILIAIYMVIYYSTSGLIAVFAIIINVIIIFAFMKLASATLTLSGIGGILLTVGMAVDANILIYERIRDELREGKTLRQAIEIGYSKAFGVIFDANLTTLICGLMLLQFGEGSVQGFALSLNVGIIATLFTGLFVTKTLCDAWYEKFGTINFGKLSWLPEGVRFDFLKLRKAAYIFSIVLTLGAVGYVGINGNNWGVDFEGGLLSEIEVTEDLTVQQVQGDHDDWRVQKVTNTNASDTVSHFILRTKNPESGNQDSAAAKSMLEQRLNETIGAGKYTIRSTENVSNEVSREFTYKAIVACVLASLGILIYLAFRFELVFGIAAVVALVHDVIIAYGAFNILGDWGLAGEVTLDVIASLLVVLGYSVNDTIIIFDRIRENRKLHPSKSDYDIINLSISETLSRTIVTISTVLIVLCTMLFFGGSGLFDFALVLLIGVFMGTISSIWVAPPIVLMLHDRARKKGKAIVYRNSGEQEVKPMLNR